MRSQDFAFSRDYQIRSLVDGNMRIISKDILLQKPSFMFSFPVIHAYKNFALLHVSTILAPGTQMHIGEESTCTPISTLTRESHIFSYLRAECRRPSRRIACIGHAYRQINSKRVSTSKTANTHNRTKLQSACHRQNQPTRDSLATRHLRVRCPIHVFSMSITRHAIRW